MISQHVRTRRPQKWGFMMNDHVMQGLADGQKPAIGHDGQEDIVHSSKNHKEIHLSEAAYLGGVFSLCLNIHQHPRDSGGDKADVNKGQVGEEEVHGGVEVGVSADGQDDEQVPQHGNQEHGQEHSKEKGLLFWIV